MKKLVLTSFLLLSLNGFSQQKETHKGNLLYLQSQYERAEEHYREALKKDSHSTEARFNLGNTVYKQRRYDEAALHHGSVASQSKDKKTGSAAWYNQGVSYTKLKNLEASIESYKNALRLNPNDREARENLQKALLEKKQKQKQQQQKPRSRLSQKEAEQKLKLLQQKEKQIQQRLQNKAKKEGQSKGQDW